MKRIINKLSVRGKIFLIIGLNLAFLFVISGIAYNGLGKLDSIKNDISLNGKALQYQLSADMMHDALRSDCYNAMLTKGADEKAMETVRADFQGHVTNFNEQIAALNTLRLSPELTEALKEVEAPLAAYVKSSTGLLEMGLNRSADSTYQIRLEETNVKFKESFDALAVQMEQLSGLIAAEALKNQTMGEQYTTRIKNMMLVLIGLVVVIAIIISNWIARTITTPIAGTREVLNRLSSGENVDELQVESRDELGQMVTSINSIVSNLNHVKEYVGQVGKGNFDVSVSIFNNNGEIYESLNKMRESLRNTSEEDKKRSWATQGLAKFADILRADTSDLQKFYDNIISSLVRYMDANQGGLYVLNEDINKNKYIDLVACYAFQKKKYLSKRIEAGEGLVGQCVLENDTIYLTDVPENYIEITSGLGDAPPRCILIVPLKVNDVSYGVVELASFTPFEKHHIEFVEKVGESIASTVSAVKTNTETKHLLEVSQQQAEQMRAQEEEMRQNLEEMQATQEEMERKELQMKEMLEQAQQQEEEIRQNMEEMQATQEEMEKQSKIMAEWAAESKGVLDGIDATMATIEFTPDGHVLKANELFLATMKCHFSDIEGKHHRNFVPAEILDSEDYSTFWSRLASGMAIKGEFKRINAKGETVWLNAIYNPIKNAEGKVSKVVKFANDITENKLKEAQIQQMLEESKIKEEELKRKDIEAQQLILAKTLELKEREDVFNFTTILSEADTRGVITYANQKLADVSQYSMDELMGKPHNLFRHPDMPQELFKLMWDYIKNGRIFRGIIKNRAKDGSHYWVDACIVPIADNKGKIYKYTGVRYHITDEEIALKMYNEQAKKKGWPVLG